LRRFTLFRTQTTIHLPSIDDVETNWKAQRVLEFLAELLQLGCHALKFGAANLDDRCCVADAV
ncbi:MAG: hypothetical protein AAF514_20175, partial [Verrucomicrobiota bacterium]